MSNKDNPLSIPNNTYDKLKGFTMYVMPGVVTLWLTIGTIWAFPYTTEIGATLTALTTFAGILVGVTKAQYNKEPADTDGDLLLDIQEDGSQSLTVALEKPPEEFRDKELVMFRVVADKGM